MAHAFARQLSKDMDGGKRIEARVHGIYGGSPDKPSYGISIDVRDASYAGTIKTPVSESAERSPVALIVVLLVLACAVAWSYFGHRTQQQPPIPPAPATSPAADSGP